MFARWRDVSEAQDVRILVCNTRVQVAAEDSTEHGSVRSEAFASVVGRLVGARLGAAHC